MFAVFNFVFVAPGVMVQTQPKFIANRDVFEKREKKAKTYSWVVFCIAEIVAELPYLMVCAALFWCCWCVPMFSTIGLANGQVCDCRSRPVCGDRWTRLFDDVLLRDALHWNR
jgi:hypothetical protein